MPVYIAGGYYEEGKGLEELASEMEESVSMGANAIKMKIGGAAISEDVERVRVVREAVGPTVKLMVDANCAYRYSQIPHLTLSGRHSGRAACVQVTASGHVGQSEVIGRPLVVACWVLAAITCRCGLLSG